MDATHYHPEKLKEAREKLGKSMQQIAEKIAVDRQTIYRAEAGKNASYELLAALCKLYKIPMSAIVVDFPSTVAA